MNYAEFSESREVGVIWDENRGVSRGQNRQDFRDDQKDGVLLDEVSTIQFAMIEKIGLSNCSLSCRAIVCRNNPYLDFTGLLEIANKSTKAKKIININKKLILKKNEDGFEVPMKCHYNTKESAQFHHPHLLTIHKHLNEKQEGCARFYLYNKKERCYERYVFDITCPVLYQSTKIQVGKLKEELLSLYPEMNSLDCN